MNLEINCLYAVSYIPICLGNFKYKGVVIDHDAEWIYMNCLEVGRKAFRKSQVVLTQEATK